MIIVCAINIFMVGCQKQITIIESSGIEFIERRANQVKGSIDTIVDQNRIQAIVAALNSANKDPAVFKAKQTLKIIYTNGKNQLVLINGNNVKVNGLTYKLDNPIRW